MNSINASTRLLELSDLSEEDFEAVQAFVSLMRSRSGATATPLSREEWSRALREWAADHPLIEGVADDSRESIYAGRGE